MPLSYILQGTEIISYDVNVTQYTCICQIEFLALLYMKPQRNKNQKSLKWSCTEPESRLMHKGWEKRYQFGSSIIVGMVSWWVFLHVWEGTAVVCLRLFVSCDFHGDMFAYPDFGNNTAHALIMALCVAQQVRQIVDDTNSLHFLSRTETTNNTISRLWL